MCTEREQLGIQIDQILPRLLEINWLGTQSNRAMEKHLRLFSGHAIAWNAEFEKCWREHPEEPAEEARNTC
jgi:hypothetical protein